MSLPLTPTGTETETPEAEPLPIQPSPVKSLLREIIETILLTVLIYVAVNFATGRFRVEGNSMEPSVHDSQYVLVDKISYKLVEPQRGDVVVFYYPLGTERDFIKRVIGLPGETVSVANGGVRINGQAIAEPYIAAPPNYESTWTLGPGQFFVLGDNRNSSSDSHSWGPLDRKYLIGKAVLVYWPPTHWGLMPHYAYPEPIPSSSSSYP
ncbi:MAG: signal peptidase I [Anaerolineales bacterium]